MCEQLRLAMHTRREPRGTRTRCTHATHKPHFELHCSQLPVQQAGDGLGETVAKWRLLA